MIDPGRLAANVAWLFTEHPWADRFTAAFEAGFTQVELPWPEDATATAAELRRAGVRVAMLNAPAGDLAAGERGWPNDPSRVSEWRAAFTEALELADEVGCPTINVLAGNRLARVSEADQLASLEANLRWAIDTATPRRIGVVTELLNASENPDYLLVTLDDADAMLSRLGPLGWRLQLDTWHLALTETDVPDGIRRVADRIGHVQVADAPGRGEPGSGGLDWRAIREALAAAGYTGAVGLEYRPRGGTLEGLPRVRATLTGEP